MLIGSRQDAGSNRREGRCYPNDIRRDSDLFGDDSGTKEPAIDPERDETLNILTDLVNLSHGPKTASTNH